MNEKHESDNVDDIMLPGFRFHPTDEELVSFYLRRKIQQRPLTIELIKQLDIYKYDPWDLPKLATTGEKEWYFYCPRDRKYRNSARPNRVTRAGFWKATGTDRPVYSSDGFKCIGLKKSLVFYQGRAAKGMKTDWMMHEFRLPSSLTNSTTTKRLPMEKNLSANDSWAICRIFKKTNTIAQRALSNSWISSPPETTSYNNIPTTETSLSNQLISCSNDLNKSNIRSFHPMDDFPSFNPSNPTLSTPSLVSIINGDLPSGFNMFSAFDMSHALLENNNNSSSSNASDCLDFGGLQQQCGVFSTSSTNEIEAQFGEQGTWFHNQLESFESVEFPISLSDELRSSLPWGPLSCPTELFIDYSNNKCYT